MAGVSRLSRLEQAVILTVGYTDQFEYPLSFSEIWQRLIRVPSEKHHQKKSSVVTKMNVKKAVFGLVKKGSLIRQGNLFALPKRESLFALRRHRKKISQQKKKALKDFQHKIKNIPWIKAVFITGSLAMENSEVDHDNDFMIVTEPRRLWLSRLWLLWQSARAGRRRTWQTEKADSWCLNLWVDTAHLALPQEQQSIYSAYEVVQAVPLWGSVKTVRQFYQENEWVREFLPHWQLPIISLTSRKSKQLPPLSFIWDFFDFLAWGFQLLYMLPHKTSERVGRGFAFFHPRDTAALVKKRWQASVRGVE